MFNHLVYAAHRADEFEQRLAGASYEEIARAGGGILSTVLATRAADAAPFGGPETDETSCAQPLPVGLPLSLQAIPFLHPAKIARDVPFPFIAFRTEFVWDTVGEAWGQLWT